MPKQPHQIQPPRRIFWVLGWTCLAFGVALFACGYYLAHEDIARILGLALVAMGGIGFGIGGRMLASCWIGLKKSRQHD